MMMLIFAQLMCLLGTTIVLQLVLPRMKQRLTMMMILLKGTLSQPCIERVRKHTCPIIMIVCIREII
jgi:hypothetical protein